MGYRFWKVSNDIIDETPPPPSMANNFWGYLNAHSALNAHNNPNADDDDEDEIETENAVGVGTGGVPAGLGVGVGAGAGVWIPAGAVALEHRGIEDGNAHASGFHVLHGLVTGNGNGSGNGSGTEQGDDDNAGHIGFVIGNQ